MPVNLPGQSRARPLYTDAVGVVAHCRMADFMAWARCKISGTAKRVGLVFVLLVSAMAPGSWAEPVVAEPAPAKLEMVDISHYDWRHQAGDAKSWKTREFDDSKWPTIIVLGPGGPAPKTGPNGMVWFRVRIPANELAQFSRPAIFLGRISDSDQVFFDGELIGSTGRIYQSVRGYQGAGPALLSRVYPLPVRHTADRPGALALRVQSALYLPGPGSGPILLGELDELNALARQRDLPIWLVQSLLVATLFVGMCVSLAGNLRDAQWEERSKWLPWSFAALLIAVVPQTLFGFETGLAKPWVAAITELSPYPLFLVLHTAAGLGTRVSRLQWCLLSAFFALAAGILFLDLSFDLFILLSWWGLAPLLLAVTATTLAQSIHAYGVKRQVSKWTYLAIASVFAGLLLYTALSQDVHPALDPATISVIAMTLFLLMAQAEHASWDREALKRVTGELLIAQDTERERLAKDLHDELSHRIAAIRLRLEALLHRPMPPEKTDLQTPISELRETGMEISALVEGLRPATLDPLNFSDAVSQAVGRWNRIGELEMSLDCPLDVKLPAPTQIQIMRILQEALHNAVRHADARNIHVRLRVNNHTASLFVSDNGIGFDPGDAANCGLGLRTMRERAGLVSKHFSINSSPGQGTTIAVEFDTR